MPMDRFGSKKPMQLSALLELYDKINARSGEVAEWSIASDLKSDEVKASESSNLSLSVVFFDVNKLKSAVDQPRCLL
jgi:hypothetical protein